MRQDRSLHRGVPVQFIAVHNLPARVARVSALPSAREDVALAAAVVIAATGIGVLQEPIPSHPWGIVARDALRDGIRATATLDDHANENESTTGHREKEHEQNDTLGARAARGFGVVCTVYRVLEDFCAKVGALAVLRRPRRSGTRCSHCILCRRRRFHRQHRCHGHRLHWHRNCGIVVYRAL